MPWTERVGNKIKIDGPKTRCTATIREFSQLENSMDSSRQISLATLICYTTAFAFFVATTHWVLTSTAFAPPEITGAAEAFGFPIIIFGLITLPLICLGGLIAIVGISLRRLRTSISSLMFVGYGCVALSTFFLSTPPTGSALRVASLLALSSCACIAETHFRDLPNWHRWIAVITMFVSLGFYLLLALMAGFKGFL
ncbi:hypothetical protein N9Y42_04965 [Mariniblastus sp.]|nr:hypothetical protein [Mariniblastus sp.]